MGSAFDVAIVGGGPAGCAAGLSLRAHAPGLSVVLLEASAYETPRVGETLPPLSRCLLEHLGVRYVREELESYSRVRTRYYAEERRWPESELWRRRAG